VNLLEINPKARWTTEIIGEGKHKVVLADDFYLHAEQVGGLAQSLYYCGGPMHGNFPGARAVVSLNTHPLIAAMSEAWGARLQQAGGAYQPVVFSAIQNDPQRQLNVAQRQPHIDPGVSAMVYLNHSSECAGGTGIYRNIPTGLERIPTQPTPEILALAAEHSFSPGDLATPEGYTAFQDAVIFAPPYAATGNEYINDGNDSWKLLYKIEMKFNRLVIFDGRMPHSQHLASGEFQGCTRLNQIVYLEPA
jgi:hypothetical protein